MKKIDRAVRLIAKYLNYVSFLCFGGIMFFVVVDVLMRFVLNRPILGSFEIVEQLMLCGVFCSFAYAQTTGTHIHVTMLVTRVPKKAGLVIYGLGELLSTTICVILAYAIWEQGKLAYAQSYTTAILKFSTVPFLYLAAAASGIFALTLLYEAARNFAAIGNKPLFDEITSHWT